MFLPYSFFLFSCNSSHDSFRDNKIFTYNQVSDISSLDPAFSSLLSNIWAVNQLYNGLVQLDSNSKITPCIATNWTINTKGTEYTFHLRTDIYFNNDSCFAENKPRKVKAADVVYSFNRIINSLVASPGSWIFKDKIDSGNGFVALNDSTFQLKLRKPFAPMLYILTMKYCSIIPHEAIERYGGNFRIHPVGTGPFYLKYWNEGVAMLLLRNDHYFETNADENIPFVHGVFITFIDSRSTEFLKFKSGELDYLSDVDPAFKSNLFTGAGQLNKYWTGKVNFKKFVFLNTEYIGFNVKDSSTKNPFADEQLRHAISYGIDKESICTYLLHGIGVPAVHGFIPFGLRGFDVNQIKGYAYNPSLAEKLAAPFHHVRLTLNCSPDNEGICNFAAADLREIGLNVQVITVQPKALNQMMVKGETAFFRGSWVADYPEPENFLACFYSGYGAPPDYSRFHNRTYDSLYEQSLATINDSVRGDVYKEMDQLMIDQAPVIPLYYDEGIELTQPYISGLLVNSTGLLDLRHVRIN